MTKRIDRRQFVRTGAAGLAGAGLAAVLPDDPARAGEAPTVRVPRAVRPKVISDLSGIEFTNGGPESAVERAFRRITEGEDVLDALVEGANIPELDPTETGIGYGGLPNADGVVQLDSCCMHGPRKWAGGVAALEGVRTPSRVAKAVMENTDHHLLVGPGAQEFARMMGFEIEGDLTTERSRRLWLEWKRRIDPGHWLDPRERIRRGHEIGLEMMREGLIRPGSFWGTIAITGVGPGGELCGLVSTSGLPWKIPGRVGDSPILGAGLYVDGGVGAAGSTGRGEANLFNLSCYLIVEQLRQGKHPKDAGMVALRRIVENTVEPRLLNERGTPSFDVRFFILDRNGEHAGVSLYGATETEYALCTENGPERRPFETLLSGPITDS